MASNKSFISLPSTPKLGASSSPLIGGGTKLSAAPKLKKSSFSFRPVGKSSLVDTISAAPPGQANMEAISESLIETNRILVEIQNQLAMDFAYRIAKEKGELKQQRQEESRRKFSKREQGLEGLKGIFKAVSSVGKAVAAPFVGIFDKIKAILGILAAGIATNALITWFKDENNRKKLKKFFNILTTNWKLIAKVLATIIAIQFVSKIVGAGSVLFKLFKFLSGPVGLALLTAAAAAKLNQDATNMAERKMTEAGIDKEKAKIPGSEDSKKAAKLLTETVSNPLTGGGLVDILVEQRRNPDGTFKSSGKPIEDAYGIKSAWDIPLLGSIFRAMSPDQYQEYLNKRKSEGDSVDGERKLGGPGYKGKTYLTGERGPELITFPENGVVFNHTNTEKVYNMLTEGGKGKVEVYDMRTVKQKQERSAPKPVSMDKPVPELSPIKDNSERLKFMAAYGVT